LGRGNPKGISRFEDLTRPGVRFVNRQAGAGTRLLLDLQLEQHGIQPDSIEGYDKEFFTHIEVGLAVLSGEADTGLATAAVSTMLGLDFVPVTRERFDMICPRHLFFQKGVQALMEVLAGDVFRGRVEQLKSYDFKDAGRVLFVKD